MTVELTREELGAVADEIARAVAAKLSDTATAPTREWGNLSELCQYLHYSRPSVARLRDDGLIPVVELPDGTLRYHFPSVTAALLSRFETRKRRSA